MDEQNPKELIIRAGKELLISGLVSRTWGNVSCRTGDNTFAVTPSGRSYETLSPGEIVICRTEDCAYEGEIKPSSEKGIHALLYRTRPDVNFIIHTHQSMASAVSVLEIKSIPSPGFSELGENVPIADYGLPGSGKLRENVGKAIERCGGHAVIMAHHGALCFGECYEEAFRAARQLEEACSAFMRGRYLEISGAQSFNEKEFYGFYASKALGEGTLGKNPGLSGNSRRIKRGFIMESENNKEYGFDDGVFSENALLHGAIYLKRKDVNFIEQATDGGLFEASYTGRPVLPMLDDFAQIIGDKAECAKSAKPEHVVMALKNRAAVLIPGSGAVCCTAEKDDLNAVRFIMGKNMLAQICGEFFGSGRKLSLLDCAVMRFIYTKSYSKKAKNNYK